MYKPHRVQTEAHKAFLVDGYKKGVLYWGRQVGKLIDVETPILTPSGFVKLDKLKVNDTIYSPNGKPAKILNITDKTYNKKTYEIEFSDGSVIKACSEHLWEVWNIKWRGRDNYKRTEIQPKILTTEEMTKYLGNVSRMFVRTTEPIQFEHSDLPIDPYSLGLWIGDGHSDQPYITALDTDAEEYKKLIAYDWVKTKKSISRIKLSLSAKDLRDNNLLKNKHIPISYITSSYESRLELIKGLMDTDGSYHKNGSTVEFYQKNEQTIDDFRTLLATMGWKSSKNSKLIDGERYWTVRFRPTEQVFKLPRKAERLKLGVEHPKNKRLYIADIREVDSVPMKCLEVDDESHLFLVGKTLIPTHNSMFSIQQLVFSAILNQGQHFIVFKEYQQAEQVAWTQYLHTIPKNLIAKTDKSSLTITFNYIGTNAQGEEAYVNFPEPIGRRKIEHDESKPPSSIRLLGSDKYEQHRGAKAVGMILDEYQDQDPRAWASVYSKFFATTNGWVIYMGTAKDIDHWNELLDLAENSDNYYYSKATYRDTPYISKEWVEEDKKDAIVKGELGIWMQEMELVPFNIQGVVFPMFNKKIHVVKPDEVPNEGTDYITVDFGFAEGHPAAVAFIRIDSDDTWWVYDEIHGTGIQIDDMITQIRQKTGDRRITAIIADSARPDLIDYMQSRGLPVIPAPKKANSVPAGIQLIAQRLQPKIQIIGEPKPGMFITSNCKKSIYDMTHYKYKEIKANRPAMELPEKRWDDFCDSIRYLALFFKYGQAKNDKPINAKPRLNEFGL